MLSQEKSSVPSASRTVMVQGVESGLRAISIEAWVELSPKVLAISTVPVAAKVPPVISASPLQSRAESAPLVGPAT